jgi:hypothetical protein
VAYREFHDAIEQHSPASGFTTREVFTSLPHPLYVVGCSRPAIAADTLKEFPRGCVLGVNGSFEEAVEEQASGA